jgi:hypothetical protein
MGSQYVEPRRDVDAGERLIDAVADPDQFLADRDRATQQFGFARHVRSSKN